MIDAITHLEELIAHQPVTNRSQGFVAQQAEARERLRSLPAWRWYGGQCLSALSYTLSILAMRMHRSPSAYDFSLSISVGKKS